MGNGAASRYFLDKGFTVHGITKADCHISHPKFILHQTDFLKFNEKVEGIWCCHVLEHVPNIGLFCRHFLDVLQKDGYLAITVPNDQNIIVDGHLSLWTPVHLIYNLVVAGWDLSNCRVFRDGRDISLYTRKRERPFIDLNYDRGDLELLQPYFPFEIKHRTTNAQRTQ